VFGLNAAGAKSMTAMAPELEAVDFMTLPRYSVYSTFQSGGKSVGWVQGRTLPAPIPTRQAVELKAKSMATYGKPTEEIEAEYMQQLGHAAAANPVTEQDEPAQSSVIPTPVGRRKKDPPDDRPPDPSGDQPPA